MNTYDECLKAVAGVLLTHCGSPAEQVQPEAELQADRAWTASVFVWRSSLRIISRSSR